MFYTLESTSPPIFVVRASSVRVLCHPSTSHHPKFTKLRQHHLQHSYYPPGSKNPSYLARFYVFSRSLCVRWSVIVWRVCLVSCPRRDFDSGSSCKPFLLTLFGVLCWCYWLLVVGLASCCCCVVRVSCFQAILRCVPGSGCSPIACPSRLPYPCHPCRRDLLFIAYIIDFCTLFDIYLVLYCLFTRSSHPHRSSTFPIVPKSFPSRPTIALSSLL